MNPGGAAVMGAILIVGAVLLAVLALVSWLLRDVGARTTTTWVCGVCRAGFSDEAAARLHVEVAHPEWRP